MCIELHLKDSATPYNTSKIRFKIAWKDKDGNIASLFVRGHIWKEGEWQVAKPVLDGGKCISANVISLYENNHTISHQPKDHGFHVYVDFDCVLKESHFGRTRHREKGYTVLLVLEVDEHICSGFHTGIKGVMRTETWKKAKLLQVEEIPYNPDDDFFDINKRKPLCA